MNGFTWSKHHTKFCMSTKKIEWVLRSTTKRKSRIKNQERGKTRLFFATSTTFFSFAHLPSSQHNPKLLFLFQSTNISYSTHFLRRPTNNISTNNGSIDQQKTQQLHFLFEGEEQLNKQEYHIQMKQGKKSLCEKTLILLL